MDAAEPDVADKIWYPIWDSGASLDHSVRTLKQAAKVAGEDVRAALGMLDARYVAGDRELADTFGFRLARPGGPTRPAISPRCTSLPCSAGNAMASSRFCLRAT